MKRRHFLKSLLTAISAITVGAPVSIMPAPQSHKFFWIQTRRRAMYVSEEYRKAMREVYEARMKAKRRLGEL